MAVVAHTEEDVKLLARLMRAEAEGDGRLGMLMVGNVGINRVIADCLDFRGLRSIRQMVFQSPGGFEAVQKGYFYQRAREVDIGLARQVIRGWRYHPATNSLWFLDHLKANRARHNGLTNGTPAATNRTAFLHRANPTAHVFINIFIEEVFLCLTIQKTTSIRLTRSNNRFIMRRSIKNGNNRMHPILTVTRTHSRIILQRIRIIIHKRPLQR